MIIKLTSHEDLTVLKSKTVQIGQACFVRHKSSNLADLRKADGYQNNFSNWLIIHEV